MRLAEEIRWLRQLCRFALIIPKQIDPRMLRLTNHHQVFQSNKNNYSFSLEILLFGLLVNSFLSQQITVRSNRERTLQSQVSKNEDFESWKRKFFRISPPQDGFSRVSHPASAHKYHP